MSVFVNLMPSPELRAVQALLVFEDRMQADNSRRYALTTHEIAHTRTGVQLGAGRLMGLQDQQALLDALLGSLATESTFLPPDVVSNGVARLAWYVPGRVRPMWFRMPKSSHRLAVPWPTLLFCVEQGRLRLAALKSAARPTPDTPLFHAPLMNVHDHTGLCTGNSILPPGNSLSHRADYEAAVFATNFSHVNHAHSLAVGKREVTTIQHYRFWRDLAAAKKATFPVRALVPLKVTAGDWLSGN